MIDKEFGMLRVTRKLNEKKIGYWLWECECKCGGVVKANTRDLKRGTIWNCGCIPKTDARHGMIAENLKDKVFGELLVLERADNARDRTMWLCRCSCGNEKIVSAHELKLGKTTTCGSNLHKIGMNASAVINSDSQSLQEAIYIPKGNESSNNTNFKGVYEEQNGRYSARLGFQGSKYYLGSFPSFEEAVNARLKAVKTVHEGYLIAWSKWNSMSDEWKQENPLIFEVSKINGELVVETNME